CLSAVVVLAFLVPLVAARAVGRLCDTSSFFPDPNNDRTVTFLGANAGSAGFKLFSFASNGFLGAPANLVEVRLLNLHRKMLFNPTLSHSLDLRIKPDKPFVDAPARNQVVQTWSFSTSNPQHPIIWINIRSRRALWRPDLAVPHVEQKPLSLDYGTNLSVFVISVVLGFVCFWAAAALIRDVLRNFFIRSREDHDIGLLYGYQELPSSEASEKEVAQKESAKVSAAKAEHV
ncbi:hypothetical protein GOP47_0015981, partial [Adiantum capillus-veneris]